MKKLFSIPQAAEDLGTCPATIRTHVKDGTWPYYVIGKRTIRLDPDEIRDVIRVGGKTEDEKRAS